MPILKRILPRVRFSRARNNPLATILLLPMDYLVIFVQSTCGAGGIAAPVGAVVGPAVFHRAVNCGCVDGPAPNTAESRQCVVPYSSHEIYRVDPPYILTQSPYVSFFSLPCFFSSSLIPLQHLLSAVFPIAFVFAAIRLSNPSITRRGDPRSRGFSETETTGQNVIACEMHYAYSSRKTAHVWWISEQRGLDGRNIYSRLVTAKLKYAKQRPQLNIKASFRF